MSTPDAKGRPSGASGFKNLRAMFEQAGSSSPQSPAASAAAEPFKPKPIGRVKTNFVAIEGQNGQVGLRRLDDLGNPTSISPTPPGTPGKMPTTPGLAEKKEDTLFQKLEQEAEKPKDEAPAVPATTPPAEKAVGEKQKEPEPAPEPEKPKEEAPAPIPTPEPEKEKEEEPAHAPEVKKEEPAITENKKPGKLNLKAPAGSKSPSATSPIEPKKLVIKDFQPAKETASKPTNAKNKTTEKKVAKKEEPKAESSKKKAEKAPAKVKPALAKAAEIKPVEEKKKPVTSELEKKEPVAPAESSEPAKSPAPAPEDELAKATEEMKIANDEPGSEHAEEEEVKPIVPVEVVPPTPVATDAPMSPPPKPKTRGKSKERKLALAKPRPSSSAATSRPRPSAVTTRPKSSFGINPKKDFVPKTPTRSSTFAMGGSKPPLPTNNATPKRPVSMMTPMERTKSSEKTFVMPAQEHFVKPTPKPVTIPIEPRNPSAYGPTASSAQKSHGPISPTAVSHAAKFPLSPGRPKTPNHLNVNSKQGVRTAKSAASSPTKADPRAQERRTSSRQSMTSDHSSNNSNRKSIDSSFLARLSRPTAASANKVIDKKAIVSQSPRRSAERRRRIKKDGTSTTDDDDHSHRAELLSTTSGDDIPDVAHLDEMAEEHPEPIQEQPMEAEAEETH